MDRVLNKGTQFNSYAEGQKSLRQTILYDYNNKSIKSKSKKQFQHGVRIDLFSATISSCQSSFHNFLEKKGVMISEFPWVHHREWLEWLQSDDC